LEENLKRKLLEGLKESLEKKTLYAVTSLGKVHMTFHLCRSAAGIRCYMWKSNVIPGCSLCEIFKEHEDKCIDISFGGVTFRELIRYQDSFEVEEFEKRFDVYLRALIEHLEETAI